MAIVNYLYSKVQLYYGSELVGGSSSVHCLAMLDSKLIPNADNTTYGTFNTYLLHASCNNTVIYSRVIDNGDTPYDTSCGVFTVVIGQGHRPNHLTDTFSFWSTATNNANSIGPMVEMFSQIDNGNGNNSPVVALMGSSSYQGGTIRQYVYLFAKYSSAAALIIYFCGLMIAIQ